MKKFVEENKYYLKNMITVFGINALLYFIIKLFLNNYHFIGWELDNKIPFVPEFMYIYMIWYPFLFVSFFYIWKKHPKKFTKLILSIIVALSITFVIFLVYPTKVVRPDVQIGHTLTSLLTYIVYLLDEPVNCFPSVHCLMCFELMFFIFMDKKLDIKWRIFTHIVCILIIASTLLVKQHVIIDAIGALIITITTYILVNYFPYFKKMYNIMNKSLQ